MAKDFPRPAKAKMPKVTRPDNLGLKASNELSEDPIFLIHQTCVRAQNTQNNVSIYNLLLLTRSKQIDLKKYSSRAA
jgi:hypothetical protein